MLVAAAAPAWLDPGLTSPTLGVLTLNAAPVLALWLAMWGLIGKPLTASACTTLAVALLHGANRIKLQHLDVPVLPSDILALGQFAASPDLFARYLDIDPLLPVLALGAALIGWFEPASLRAGRRRRVVLLGAGSVMLAGIPLHLPPWYPAYSQRMLGAQVWLPKKAAEQIGLIPLLVQLTPQALDGPDDPDPRALAEFERLFGEQQRARVAAPLPDVLPDLIVLQSESFFDPARVSGLQHSEHLPNFRRLAALGRHGSLEVPTYGGLTTRTEFEFLTGLPMHLVPGTQYPYQSLVGRPFHALPWALKQLGYATRAIHPYDRRFYRRNLVYPLLGFERFADAARFAAEDYHGFYVSDRALNRLVQDQLDEAAPRFVFAVSMENHGPWNDNRPLPADELATIAVPAALQDAEANQLRRYLHHLGRADAALGALADWVLQRERPTVLLFFGDHLPGLHEIYERLSFVDGRSGPEQTVPWLLLDNRDPTGKPAQHLAAHQLAPLLLDQAGINRDAHFVASSLLREPHARLSSAVLAELGANILRAAFIAATDALPPTMLSAPVVDWGPRSSGWFDDRSAAGQTVWIEFEQAPPNAGILIDGHAVTMLQRAGRRLYGVLSPVVRDSVRRNGATLALRTDDGGIHRIGTIRGDDHASASTAECRVSGWGPQSSDRATPANRQPDGSLGLWVKAQCVAARTTLAFDGLPLRTTIDGGLATALVPTSLLEAGSSKTIELIDPERGIAATVGAMQLTD